MIMAKKKEPTVRVCMKLKPEDALDYEFTMEDDNFVLIKPYGMDAQKIIIHFGDESLVQIGWKIRSSSLGVQEKFGTLFSGYIETKDEFKILLRQLRISK